MRAVALELGCTWALVMFASLLAGCGGGDRARDLDAAAVVDAADAPSGCGPGTCAGCCAFGLCFEGTSASACGAGGAACASCPAGVVCTAAGACAADPCEGVGEGGACASATEVAVCTWATGDGGPGLATYPCAAGEECRVTGGVAGCVLTATCREGTSECADAATLRTCTGGDWQPAGCPRGCVESALGASCAPDVDTRALTGRLRYQRRRAVGDPPSGWGPLEAVDGEGVLVLAARLDPAGGPPALFDVAVSSEGGASPGTFTVRVPAAPTADDHLLFVAAGAVAGPGGHPSLAHAVVDPGLAPSPTPYPLGSAGVARPWTWGASIAGFAGTMTITDADFSGALQVFDAARRAAASMQARFGRPPRFLVWLAPGVGWTCGTCEWSVPTARFGGWFAQQVFLRSGAADEAYWADAVTLHELGHVAMAAYGRDVGEGGRHCFGVPTAPGQAWSEGYATWFSADLRGDPRYVDRQGGTMVWFDLARRTAAGGGWPRAIAAAGLEQELYENEVAAMLWALSATHGLGRAPIDAAIASPRLRVPPFERGYTRHTWSLSPGCERVAIEDTGVSTPHLADLLDALVCAGAAPSTIDAVTEPASHYPYPSGAPLCRP